METDASLEQKIAAFSELVKDNNETKVVEFIDYIKNHDPDKLWEYALTASGALNKDSSPLIRELLEQNMVIETLPDLTPYVEIGSDPTKYDDSAQFKGADRFDAAIEYKNLDIGRDPAKYDDSVQFKGADRFDAPKEAINEEIGSDPSRDENEYKTASVKVPKGILTGLLAMGKSTDEGRGF